MGTSKSNSGLRPNLTLLPDYAPPPDQNDYPPTEDESKEGKKDPITGDWSNAKAALTAVTKASGGNVTRQKLKSAARQYISGSGGARKMRQSAIGGRLVGRNLGRVLFAITSNGVDSAFADEGIDNLAGQSAEVIFAKLAQQLSSQGGTVEETIANVAIAEALEYLYIQFELDTKNFSSLDALTENQAREVIQVYVSSYIFERWIHELGIKIERSDLSERQIVDLEDDIREFIRESVKLNFGEKPLQSLKFNRKDDKKAIDEIFNQAYKMLEDL